MAVGLLAAIMGVGGGFIMIPAMIYLLGVPTNVVVGTSLFQIMFVTGLTTLLHATTNRTVDAVLALLLIIGGVVGAQIGVRIGAKLKSLKRAGRSAEMLEVEAQLRAIERPADRGARAQHIGVHADLVVNPELRAGKGRPEADPELGYRGLQPHHRLQLLQ